MATNGTRPQSENGMRARSESAMTQRMRASGTRAVDAYASIQRQARRLCNELDDVTAPHGVQTTELHEEDSLVTSVESVIAANTNDTANHDTER